MEKKRIIIEKYLENPDSVYVEWYKKKQQKDTGQIDGEFTSVFPPVDKIKEVFDNWIKEKIVLLKIKICIEWDYIKKEWNIQMILN